MKVCLKKTNSRIKGGSPSKHAYFLDNLVGDGLYVNQQLLK